MVSEKKSRKSLCRFLPVFAKRRVDIWLVEWQSGEARRVCESLRPKEAARWALEWVGIDRTEAVVIVDAGSKPPTPLIKDDGCVTVSTVG